MRKTLMTAALAIPMALLAVSAFAATPTEQPQSFTPAYVATGQVSQYLADEIFLPASPAPVFAVIYGVCSSTCDECYSSNDCPRLEGSGLRQTCTYACY
ncbi:MAG TPA: hypothetical protein VIA62_28500 [Thermoanaerobaculia bacterium]|jgi:hypothetical protein|nr:hypothetical protein [Thermoanaerobaculia bacterium]